MKKLFLGLLAVFVILLAVVLAAPYFISASTLKKPLIEKVQELTGRTLTIDGALRMTFFPVAGITVENVTLSNPPGYGDAPPFITLKSLEVGVAVMPLLHKDIQVEKLVLDEAHINLHVNKSGVQNWQFAKAGTPESKMVMTSEAKMPAANAVPAPIALPPNLHLSDVVMKDSVVTYADDSDNAKWDLGKLNARVALTSIEAPFTLSGDGEWNHKTIKVSAEINSLQKLAQMQAAAVDGKVTSDLLSLNIHGSLSMTDYRGKLDVNSSSLKDLMAWANPAGKSLPTPAPLVLALSGDAQCSRQSCTFSAAHLTLDKIDAKGTVKAIYGGAKPSLALNITTGVLDFNPFLPAEAQKHADGGMLVTDALAKPAEGWSNEPIDFSALREVDLTADVTADGVKYHQITLGKTTLRTLLSNGHLSFTLVEADLYGGKGNGSIVIDGASSPPVVESRLNLSAVDAKALLQDAAGITRISGKTDFALNTASHGTSESDLVSSMGGNGSFKLTDGVIQGIDLAHIPQNLASGLKLSDNPAQTTAIKSMSATFTIVQGVVSNHDLVMDAAALHMTGEGSIYLPQRNIDYRLTPQIVSGQGQTAKSGLAVPIVISGGFDDLTFRPDLKSVVQEAIKNPKKLREELKNSRSALRDQLNSPNAVNNLKGLLKGL